MGKEQNGNRGGQKQGEDGSLMAQATVQRLGGVPVQWKALGEESGWLPVLLEFCMKLSFTEVRED